MTDQIKNKDDNLKRRAMIFGQGVKLLSAGMAKKQIEIHNDTNKMKELIEAMVGAMKGYALEEVSQDLAKQLGAAMSQFIRGLNALGECDATVEGVLSKFRGWSGDLQKLGDPKLTFDMKKKPPEQKIVAPTGGLVDMRGRPLKGGDQKKH